MVLIVWEFIVKLECIERFRTAYGPGGDWAVLFQQHAGYARTTLLQDMANAQRFLTIDEWRDEASWRHMHQEGQVEYARLDARLGDLTLSERELGVFES